MAAVTFSPKARQDLLDIGDYIANGSIVNARRFIDKLIARCRRIGHAPRACAGREELAPGLRMAAMGRYVVFFRAIGSTVRIERVLHSTRNLPVVLGDDTAETAASPAPTF